MTTATLHPPARSAPRLLTWSGVGLIIVAVVAVAMAGRLITAPAVSTWYADLPKPTWTPPAWVFGPVWGALYAMMAVAASMVWVVRARRDDICCPIAAFGIQLLLNLVWSILFFGLKSPLLAFLDIGLLWIAVSVTTVQFFLVSRPAGWLMVPYWAWLTFAAALNGAIMMMAG